MSDKKFARKPLGNFFIKKSLQLRLILKVMAVALVTAVVSSGSLIVYYYLKSNSLAFYMMDMVTDELTKGSLLEIVLPALAISAAVAVSVAFGIGLYASRKYAVPIFKIEQWASMLQSGKMSAILRFREYEEMKELSQKCNELGAQIRGMLLDIKTKVKAMKSAGANNPEIDMILAKLDGMELEEEGADA